eukprot:jgi/Psemu1/309217/fgenesh1_kg.487_\
MSASFQSSFDRSFDRRYNCEFPCSPSKPSGKFQRLQQLRLSAQIRIPCSSHSTISLSPSGHRITSSFAGSTIDSFGYFCTSEDRSDDHSIF